MIVPSVPVTLGFTSSNSSSENESSPTSDNASIQLSISVFSSSSSILLSKRALIRMYKKFPRNFSFYLDVDREGAFEFAFLNICEPVEECKDSRSVFF